LNEHFGLEISEVKLKHLAGRLGADCSFFLENTPCYATGRGEILTPMGVSLKGYHLLLVKPPYGVDTKTAYSGVAPQAFPFNFKELITGPVTVWQNKIRNDFEPSVFAKYPELGAIKGKLAGMGALYASMSGSGSSVYALYDHEPFFNASDFPAGTFFWHEELI
jgi:4-diphosphocytidyl-2-C-methyl-D-erythritol kinase